MYLVLASIIATLSMNSWTLFVPDNDSGWDSARAEDILYVGGNEVVIAGYAAWIDIIGEEVYQDRAAIGMKLILDSSEPDVEELFTYEYKAGSPLDDDAYTLIPYETENSEDGYVLFGYHQCAADHAGYQGESRLLAVGILDDEDTPVAEAFNPILTGNREQNDQEYRDAVYTDNGRYIACGWYFPTHDPGEQTGFLQFFNRGSSLSFISDTNVDSWENVIVSSVSGYQVLGGFGGTSNSRLYFGVYSGNTMFREYHTESNYAFVEGPLVEVSDNTFLYFGKGIHVSSTVEAYAPTLWAWNGLSIQKLDTDLLSNDTGGLLADYEHLGLNHAEMTRNGILSFASAQEKSGTRRWGILITRTVLNTSSIPNRLGSTSIVQFVPIDIELSTNEIAEMRGMVVTDLDDFHAYGAGKIFTGPEDDQIWMFEITEDDFDPQNASIFPTRDSKCNLSSSVVASPWTTGLEVLLAENYDSRFLVNLFSVDGRLVYSDNISSSSSIVRIPESEVAHLNTGVYLIEIQDLDTGYCFSQKTAKL